MYFVTMHLRGCVVTETTLSLLSEMADHYASEPRTRFTVAWEPSVVEYFVGFYGGVEGKQVMRA